MKTHFTADGYQRWLRHHQTAASHTTPNKLTDDQIFSGGFRKLRRWWRTSLASLRGTSDEKSSPKILW